MATVSDEFSLLVSRLHDFKCVIRLATRRHRFTIELIRSDRLFYSTNYFSCCSLRFLALNATSSIFCLPVHFYCNIRRHDRPRPERTPRIEAENGEEDGKVVVL